MNAACARSCFVSVAGRNLLISLIRRRALSTAATAIQPETSSPHSTTRVKKISKAMLSYIEGVKHRDAFIRCENAEYELGKRHLANMMGIDATSMTQDDINLAIEYLFPSGIFSKRSRPMMKPPTEFYPPQKPLQFESDGRPYHSLFYTAFPNFYQILFDIRESILKVQAYEDRQTTKGIPLPDTPIDLGGTDWITLEQLQKLTLENITKVQYEQFLAAAKSLVALPYSNIEKQFLMTLRGNMGIATMEEERLRREEAIKNIEMTADGRQMSRAVGIKKKFRCYVKLIAGGSGKILLNERPLNELFYYQSIENILFPFILLDRLGQFDVEAVIESKTAEHDNCVLHIGESAYSAAARHGIAQALLAFVTAEEAAKLRLAGLLTLDVRRPERKKIGQPKARAKWIWKKR